MCKNNNQYQLFAREQLSIVSSKQQPLHLKIFAQLAVLEQIFLLFSTGFDILVKDRIILLEICFAESNVVWIDIL